MNTFIRQKRQNDRQKTEYIQQPSCKKDNKKTNLTNDVGAWAGDEASGAAGNYWLPTASAGHRRH